MGENWDIFTAFIIYATEMLKWNGKKMDELIKVKFHVMHRHRQNEPLQSILQRNLWIKMGEYYASISYPGQWFYALRHCYRYSKPMQSQRIFTFKLTAKIYENRKPCVNDVVRERTNNCWLGNITDPNETPCFISFTLNGRYQCWKFILYWSELHETNFFSSLIYVPFFWHNAAHKFVARSQYMFFCFYFCYVYIIHQNILLIHVYSLRFELFN